MHVGHVGAEHDDGAVAPVTAGVGKFERIGARDLELPFFVAREALLKRHARAAAEP